MPVPAAVTLTALEQFKAPSKAFPERLFSLDLFRGTTIAAMILVNAQSDEDAAFWPLKHTTWNGWTTADLVFPFFLFIVGVSLVYSFESRLWRGESRRQITLFVLRRGLVLFAAGVLLNGFPNHYHLATWRVEGVLQRIAICYVIGALLTLWYGRRARIAAIVLCLVGYWALLQFVPVPGYGTPGHDIPLLDPNHNLAAWLDRKLFAGHLLEGTSDPEGLLATIPAIATVLFGVFTGEWLRFRSSHSHARATAAWMIAAGIAAIAVGEIISIWLPLNKKLWTSSFAVFTAGFALVFLALCYWLADVLQWRGRWTKPLLVFGMNPIAAYIFSEGVGHAAAWLLGLSNADQQIPGPESYGRLALHFSPALLSLAGSIVFLLFCWLAMWALYRKRIFLKI